MDVSTLEGWSYVHKVVGKNVIIAGRDESSTAKETKGSRPPRDRVGTLKGVADFMRQYAGTRFLYPARGPDDETSIEFTNHLDDRHTRPCITGEKRGLDR